MTDKTRSSDFESLIKMERTATNEAERTAVRHSMHKLAHEDRRIASMRAALVKATREGNRAEVRDIHEYVASHRALQNDR